MWWKTVHCSTLDWNNLDVSCSSVVSIIIILVVQVLDFCLRCQLSVMTVHVISMCLLPDPLLLTTHCPSYFKLLVSFSFATHWNQRGLHHCSIRTCRKIFHCSCKHYFSFLLSMPRDRDLNSNTVYSTADRLLHSTAL